ERELFELARREWRSAAKRELSGFEAPLFRELSGCVLYWACDCGEAAAMWREVEALVLAHGKAWYRAVPPAALLDYCHRLAFAAEGWEVFGTDAAETWKNSPHPGRRNFVRLLRELRNLPPPDEADTEALIGFFLAANSRKAAVQAAADLMRRQPKRSMGLFLYTAIAAGESGLVDKMKPLIKPEFMPLYRAMTLKGAGKYREALAAAKRIPAPEARAKVELECLIALGEFEAAGKLARNAVTPLPERTRILALLELAELSGDARYYRDAEQLAAKRIDRDAAWANSFGYVALVLGLDAEQAERRIRYALKCHPQNSSLLDSMAWALHRLGKPNEAWRYMDMALRRCRPQPESCEELEHAGAIRLALGDREGARKYYRLALKLAREGEAFTFGQARYRLHAKRIAAALEKLR
ncbi:MAG: hypothetical protein IJJ28_02555, partial [Lentisphaeria bacterium]|nr:hypothetical protein [Lentisphaeria bacterium]